MFKAFLLLFLCSVWLPETEEKSLADPFNLLKEFLFGLPSQVVSTKITILCPLLVSTGGLLDLFDPPTVAIYFECLVCKKHKKVQVSNAEDLIHMSGFSRSKPTVIIIFGWLDGLFLGPDVISTAYQKRNDVNILKLDTSHLTDKLYTKSAKNTQMIGKRLAKGLLSLSKKYDINKVHLVGFSLGAQIAGSAGRFYKRMSGRSLHRITGLDPAKPCFYTSEMPGLSRSDAKFVDVIHTNPGALGTQKAVAHVDFFVGGLNTIQSNCLEIACSHMRATEYYAESVLPGNEENFPAKWCRTSMSEPTRACKGSIAYMGYLASESAKNGMYYLEVNRRSPFGRNSFRK